VSDGPRRGFGIAAGLDPDVARAVARRCESLGYASLWSNDHPGASGLETIAVFAKAAPRPDVGVAVLALDRHAPPNVGAKLSEVGVPAARLWLGIGAGFSKRPLGVVREGLAALREELPGDVRIVVAAMGPKMCALAGAEADGAFLNWMTPEKAAWARDRVHEGAAAAGRAEPPPVFGYVRLAVGDDAEERLRKEEAFYRQLHQGYIRHFEALDAPEGTVGVAVRDPADVAPRLAEYDAIDNVVVRALAHADVDSLGNVAEAAAPQTS
jgi:alkanesulfonate monooxygenase SsuD/methylene tetrahydromethanopterin reductase-like flavin-dependent oxidoreductase (luciferase family)